MKVLEHVWLVLRVIYGVFFAAMGTLALASSIGLATPPEQPTRAAGKLTTALTDTGFIDPLLGLSFLAGGGLLLFSRTAPLGLVLLAPSVVVILFFHLVLSGQYIWGPFVAAYFLLLVWHYRRAFVPLWSYPG